MLRLIRLVAAAAASPCLVAAPGGCSVVVSPLDGRKTGTDYIGTPNISVVPAASIDECCDACHKEPTCNASIWHNLNPPTCALKAELGKPVKGSRVEVCRPGPRVSPRPPPNPPPTELSFQPPGHV